MWAIIYYHIQCQCPEIGIWAFHAVYKTLTPNLTSPLFNVIIIVDLNIFFSNILEISLWSWKIVLSEGKICSSWTDRQLLKYLLSSNLTIKKLGKSSDYVSHFRWCSTLSWHSEKLVLFAITDLCTVTNLCHDIYQKYYNKYYFFFKLLSWHSPL